MFGDFFQHGDFQVVKPRLQAGFDVKGPFDGRFEVAREQFGKGFAIGQVAFGAAMFEPVRADGDVPLFVAVDDVQQARGVRFAVMAQFFLY